MNTTIELPQELFNRLASHATGFDTPANVITRVLDFYEQRPQGTINPLNANASTLEKAFQKTFNSLPIPFGIKGSAVSGFSDGNKGVQWNVVINKDVNKIFLGVNLEGIKYKNWPITNLLLSEKSNHKILEYTTIKGADRINLRMSRDAWQAASRPPIKERHIAPNDLMLSDLTKQKWTEIIHESLSCLNPNMNFKGRNKQLVSRIKSNDQKVMEVSPHLGLRIEISSTDCEDFNLLSSKLGQAKVLLLPLYELVAELSS